MKELSKEEIIRLAEQAGIPVAWISESGVLKWSDLERFAALVADIAATEEREACEAIVKKELRGDLEGRPRLDFGVGVK